MKKGRVERVAPLLLLEVSILYPGGNELAVFYGVLRPPNAVDVPA